MPDYKQLGILKQGVEAWNRWREEHSDTAIDLSSAQLLRADLSGANLAGADLRRADLVQSSLVRTDLSGADLSEADCSGACLRGADLKRAWLRGTVLRGANLSQADLSLADLSEAELHLADLQRANFNHTRVDGTGFAEAVLGDSLLARTDLSRARGLETCHHKGPSTLGSNTLSSSLGRIPEPFLRGCGLSDWEIESARLFNPGLGNQEIIDINYRVYDLRASRALQVFPLFISYSHADSAFVNKVGDCLTENGIRYWRDIHNLQSGRVETQIDRAIRHNPTVLLVLSEHSLASDWVQHEVRTGRGLEKELGRDVLCPVSLDASWKHSPWPERLMEQVLEYNILDFSGWRDEGEFNEMFSRLLRGLELFYRP